MKILIPMAGEGKRFSENGYKIHKPLIPTIDRKTGETLPMVICATKDLPEIDENGSNVIYIDRLFHKENGVEEEKKKYFSDSSFITTEELTDGQASSCMLAKDLINNGEELLISGCDNGIVMNLEKFYELKKECDVLVFTYRNNEAVMEKPDAYGWVKVNEKNEVKGVSIKKSISNTPMNDHAIVATFWFKRGEIFVKGTEKMISENDRVNNEFYVDSVMSHLLDLNYKVKVFEVDKYIGWGTPKDYENYMDTIQYWKEFSKIINKII